MCIKIDLRLALYLLPVFPIVTRGILSLKFREEMKDDLTPKERDTESHRSYILALAGFSFSGLLALAVLDAVLRKDYRLSIYYLFMSFLGHLIALNLQSYKFTQRRDQLATALTDMGSLCLILSILGILMTQDFSRTFSYSLGIVAVSAWLVDHGLRLRYTWKFFQAGREEKDGRRKEQKKGT